MQTYETLKHTTWDYKYHVVFIPKYRRKALYAQLRRDSQQPSWRAGGGDTASLGSGGDAFVAQLRWANPSVRWKNAMWASRSLGGDEASPLLWQSRDGIAPARFRGFVIKPGRKLALSGTEPT